MKRHVFPMTLERATIEDFFSLITCCVVGFWLFCFPCILLLHHGKQQQQWGFVIWSLYVMNKIL